MNYLNVTYPDINNGLGFRVTLWVAGCSHHCQGCHNSWTWDYNLGKKLNESKDEVYNVLKLPYINGLTISGGDPLSQSEENLQELYDYIVELKDKFPNKDIWIYAGDVMEEVEKHPLKKKIIELCDYFVDGTFHVKEKDLSLAFRGSKNQRIWKKESEKFNVVKLD